MRRRRRASRGGALSGFALLVALSALFALAGCGDDDGTGETTEFSIDAPTTTATSGTATASGETSADPAATEPGSGAAPSAEPPLLPGQKRPAEPVGVVRRSGPDANRSAVVRTVRTYLLAIRGGNGELACAQLTPQAQAEKVAAVAEAVPEQKGGDCGTALLLYQGAFGRALEDPRVTAVRVSGNRASANGPARTRATLVKSANTWLISSYSEPGD